MGVFRECTGDIQHSQQPTKEACQSDHCFQALSLTTSSIYIQARIWRHISTSNKSRFPTVQALALRRSLRSALTMEAHLLKPEA